MTLSGAYFCILWGSAPTAGVQPQPRQFNTARTVCDVKPLGVRK